MAVYKKYVYPFFTTLAFLLVLYVNGSIGQSLFILRDIFPFPLMPPGMTFGIARGVIYISLFAFIGVLRTIEQTEKIKEVQRLFRASCLLNIGWILLTQAQAYGVGVFFLLALTIVLFNMLYEIKSVFLPFPKQYLLRVPIGLYLGRGVTATFVLGGSQLMHLFGGLERSAHPYRIIAGLLVTAVIGSWLRQVFRYPSVLILIVRGLLGIIMNHWTATPRIAGVALGSIMLICGMILLTLLPRTQNPKTFSAFLMLLAVFLVLAFLSKEKFREGFKLLWGVA